MGTMKSLVVLTPGFPSDESDSTCLPAVQCFIRSLNTVFPQLKIIIVASHYPYREDKYSWRRNEVIALDGKRSAKITRPLLWYKMYRQLVKLKRDANLIGVLSLWCLEEAFIGQLFSRRNGILHRIWLHGQDAMKTNPFVRLISPRPEELVAISAHLATIFADNFGVRPGAVVTNGVDINEYPPVYEQRNIDILGVGSLIPLKRYDLFLGVVAALKALNPRIRVMICGGGAEEQSIRRIIETDGLSENVVLTGELSHVEVLQLMSRSKILLHPSAYEGYSTVCIEGLYSGCHVVSFLSADANAVDHWHIVDSKEQMIETCKEILSRETNFSRVLVHDMRDAARKMLGLFDYAETTR